MMGGETTETFEGYIWATFPECGGIHLARKKIEEPWWGGNSVSVSDWLDHAIRELVGEEIPNEKADGKYRITITVNVKKLEDAKGMKYRKKPVVVEAIQITRPMTVETLEGTMKGNPGDWLITGVKGEQYFCKDEIFKMTYEPVEEMKG